MKQILFTILLISIFAGCGTSGYSVFIHDDNYYKTLSSSQKGEIRTDDTLEAIFSAAHLNVLYPKEYAEIQEEVFLVGVYIAGDRVRERGLNNSNYEVQLNSKFPYEIKPLPSDAEIVKKTSFTDKWSRYYIVTFTKQSTSTFGLKLINRTTKSGITLNFKK